MKKSELRGLIRETIRGMCCPPKPRYPFKYPPEKQLDETEKEIITLDTPYGIKYIEKPDEFARSVTLYDSEDEIGTPERSDIPAKQRPSIDIGALKSQLSSSPEWKII
jgi:hypothetical protein